MMRNKLIAFYLLLLLCPCLQAQEQLSACLQAQEQLSAYLQAQEQLPKAWSLDECIRLAWRQNPGMKHSEIGIRQARVDYTASIGRFLPQVSARSEVGKNFGRSITPETNGYTTDSFEEGSVGLDMTLSLFEGFTRINRVRFEKLNKEKSRWEHKHQQNELAYQVTDAYYKLVLEGQLLTLAAEQSRLGERYLKQTEAFVELGLKSPSDLQEVKARRAGDAYRYQSREKSLCLAELQLKQLMNLKETDSITIDSSLGGSLSGSVSGSFSRSLSSSASDSVSDSLGSSLDSRSLDAEPSPRLLIPHATALYEQSATVMPTLQMIELQQRAARKEYAGVGGLFSPSIYARFSVSSYYSGSGFSGRQLRDNVGRYVGLGISIPLLSGLERLTNLRKQKLNIYRLRHDEELLQQQLRTEVEQTVLSLHSGIEEHRQTLLQARAEAQVLKESERKWEEGLISVFQLMEARNRCLSARAELIRVRLQLEMNLKLKNYYLTGRFTEEVSHD